jgi:hypothetical protein
VGRRRADLAFALARGGQVDAASVEHLQERYARERTRHARPGVEAGGPAELSVVGVDHEHLQERLGLFIIIVLGEVVSQLVLIASTSEWTTDFIGAPRRWLLGWALPCTVAPLVVALPGGGRASGPRAG